MSHARRTRSAAGALVVGIGLLAAACTAPGGTGPAVTATGLLASSLARQEVTLAETAADDVVRATTALGLVALGEAEPGNAVFSPASAVVALAMLAEGAEGRTAAELAALLGADGQERTDAVNALLAALQELDGDPAVVQAGELPEVPVVHVANQLVVDRRVTPRSEFLDRLATGYGAGVLVTDLTSQTGKDDLDAWVREHTGGLVEQSAITPNEDLVLVLQNAITLAARWARPFDASMTRPEPFTLADGSTTDVPMMWQESGLAYAEVAGWQAVRLPYTHDLHADVLLPPEGAGSRDLDPATWAELTELLDAAAPARVRVSLPTLDLSTKTDLTPVLAQETPTALGPEAELGGLLVEDLPLAVQQAVQQAVLRVDEDGTVAAAVTEIGVGVTSAPPEPDVVIRFDRPYLFTVSHTGTGWSLFLAGVEDPRG